MRLMTTIQMNISSLHFSSLFNRSPLYLRKLIALACIGLTQKLTRRRRRCKILAFSNKLKMCLAFGDVFLDRRWRRRRRIGAFFFYKNLPTRLIKKKTCFSLQPLFLLLIIFLQSSSSKRVMIFEFPRILLRRKKSPKLIIVQRSIINQRTVRYP